MDIWSKIEHQAELGEEEVIALLSVDTHSMDYYKLLYYSSAYSKKTFGNRGYVFAQIGINAEPCPVNCRFCSMAADHYLLPERWRRSEEYICEMAAWLGSKPVSDLFLMTTADYPQQHVIQIGKKVRPVLPEGMRLVANIGDFGPAVARQLKESGFTGAYHIVRLREGTDTQMPPETREQTLEAIVASGMELYYCIEPIGPEHTYPEMAKEIFRAKKYRVAAMAVMRRTAVEGTSLYGEGEISTPELCKIAAVTNLVVRPSRSMNVHEVTEMSLMAGINQLYAEIGANPRDVKSETENNRGYSVERTMELLNKSGYKVESCKNQIV